jgi:Raf kinase inhibitor-like YbhB/YbcL family protein
VTSTKASPAGQQADGSGDATVGDESVAAGAGTETTVAVPTTPRATATTAATGGDDTRLPDAAGPLTLTLPWADGDQIPVEFTCHGAAGSPPVSWSNLLPATKQVALVFTDPDAADFVHWVIWGIPASVTSLPAAVAPTLYAQAVNGFGTIGYGAPCPPSGTHTYEMTLYELTDPLTLAAGSAAEDVISRLNVDGTDSVLVSGQAG